MAIRYTSVAVTGATGGVGVATAELLSSDVVSGIIHAVHLTYVGTPPATTDVTIVSNAVPQQTVLSISNAATDGWFFPMNQADNTVGTDITNQGNPIAVSDHLLVTIAQANDADGVTAVIIWDDRR